MENKLDASDRFLSNARAQLAAAHLLIMRDPHEAKAFIGPSLLLLGFGIESFLKVVLLDSGVKLDHLGKKPYGHDLWHMWNCEQLEAMRAKANSFIPSLLQQFENTFVPPSKLNRTDSRFSPNMSASVPEQGLFEPHLKELSDLHSSETDFALRYPVSKTVVPEPILLVSVFEALVDCLDDPIEIGKAE